MFGRMLNDVPVFDELAITDSEDLPDNDGCSAFGRREANMKKHHVVLCDDPYDLPFWLRRLLDQVSEEIDGGLCCSAGAVCTMLHELRCRVPCEAFLRPQVHERQPIEGDYDFFRTLHVFRWRSGIRKKQIHSERGDA